MPARSKTTAHSSFTLILKFLAYRFLAKGKHDAHSPYLYEFITQVAEDTQKPAYFKAIEQQRKQYLKDNTILKIRDYGAGSRSKQGNIREISEIAKFQLKPAKYTQLLSRIVQHYQYARILELGTSLGISTAYLAQANPKARVYTIEGSEEIYQRATLYFKLENIQNIQAYCGEFSAVLPQLLGQSPFDFIFIDGNHQKEPTLSYIEQLLPYLAEKGMIILDDIHWSSDMEDAWKILKKDKRFGLTIDLFFMGILCKNADLSPAHFMLKF